MRNLFFLLLVFLAIVSCKKEDSHSNFTQTKKNFVLTISNNYIPDNYQYWIIVSNNDLVLFSQQIQNGLTYEILDITSALVDIHIFKYYESLPYKYLYAYTYYDVTPGEWTLNRPYPSKSLGTITVSVNDLINIKRWTVATSRTSSSSISASSRKINAYVNPENVLISYLPSDNSPMQFKYVRNVETDQSLTYLMSDFQPATRLISYNLPAFNYFQYSIYGYDSNPNVANYRFSYFTYGNSEISKLDLFYPEGLFQNYSAFIYLIDNADTTRSMEHAKYGGLPTVLPAISYADINFTNENNIDQFSASIENYRNYQEFDVDYSVFQDSLYFEWHVESKSKATFSNSLPEIPDEIKQKSSFFVKSNLEFEIAYLFKYINGQATSFDDYISMCIKPSIPFNEVVNEYESYYTYSSSTIKKGFKKRESGLMRRNNSFDK